MALKDKLMTLEDFKAVRDVDVASNSAQFTEIRADLEDNVNDLKSALKNYNALDYIDFYGSRTNGTHNGITYTWSGRTCTINGTSTNYSVNNIFNGLLPDGVEPEKTYILKYNPPVLSIGFRFVFYDSNNDQIGTTIVVNKDSLITIPTGAVKWIAGFYIAPNRTFDNAVVSEYAILNTKSNKELSDDVSGIASRCTASENNITNIKQVLDSIEERDLLYPSTRENGTNRGVTFTWNEDKTECVATGTNSDTLFYASAYLAGSNSTIPNGLKPGGNYHALGKTTDDNYSLFLYYYVSGVFSSAERIVSNKDIIIPANTTGIIIGVGVRPSKTVTNAKVYDIGLFEKIAVDESRFEELSEYVDSMLPYNVYNIMDLIMAPANGTHNGVTYTWSGKTCIVSGTSTGTSVNNLIQKSTIPKNVVAGKTYKVLYTSSNENIQLGFVFFDSGEAESYVYLTKNGNVTIPANAVKWRIRFYVASGKNASGTVSGIGLLTQTPDGFWWDSKKWFAIGDSITYGTCSESDQSLNNRPLKSFVAICSNLIGYNLTNYGVPGMGFVHASTSTGFVDITLPDVLNRDFTGAEIVTISLGTNDYGNNETLGSLSDSSSVKSVYGRIKLIVETMQTKCPGARLIFTTPIPRATAGSAATQYCKHTDNSAGYSLDDVKAAIIESCEYYGIEYINMQDNCIINYYNKGTYLYDNLHPSTKGHELLGGFLASKMVF